MLRQNKIRIEYFDFNNQSKQLQEVNLQYNIKKCKFYTIEIMYFNLIIFHDDIKMNFMKIKIIIS